MCIADLSIVVVKEQSMIFCYCRKHWLGYSTVFSIVSARWCELLHDSSMERVQYGVSCTCWSLSDLGLWISTCLWSPLGVFWLGDDRIVGSFLHSSIKSRGCVGPTLYQCCANVGISAHVGQCCWCCVYRAILWLPYVQIDVPRHTEIFECHCWQLTQCTPQHSCSFNLHFQAHNFKHHHHLD